MVFLRKTARQTGCRRAPFWGFLLLAIGAALGLTSCGLEERGRRTYAARDAEAIQSLKKIEPAAKPLQALTVDHRPWFGSTSVPIENGDPLPPQYSASDGIVLTFEKPLGLREIAAMIQSATGIRVYAESGAAGTEGGILFVPPDGVEVSGGRIVWQGALSDLLDQIASAFDAQWRYEGGAITLSDRITKTFMLHALAGNLEVGSGLQSDTEDSASLPSINFSRKSTLEIWEEIKEAITGILGDRGSVSFSPSTGTITVTGYPSYVGKIEDYLREQNRMRLRRIAIAIKVLALETSDVESVTVRLSAILKRALEGKPFELKSVDGGLTAGILRSMPNVDSVTGLSGGDITGTAVAPTTDTITSILEASEEIDKVSVVQAGAVVTLSDIPAPLQIGRVISYLQRVSTTSSNGEVSTSLEPGEVSTGLTMNVLPRVIEKDKVLLSLSIGIKDAQQPFQTYSAGGVSIQLPEVKTTGFMQNAVLSQGETLVLAGFEKNQDGYSRDGPPGGFLGGTQSLDRGREVSVLLISTEILPEDPLTVIGQ